MFFCVWFISHNIVFSSFIHVVTNGRISFLFIVEEYSWPIYLSIYVTLLWWTLRLFPYLGCCEYCCNEHGREDSPELLMLFLLDIYPEWDCLIKERRYSVGIGFDGLRMENYSHQKALRYSSHFCNWLPETVLFTFWCL